MEISMARGTSSWLTYDFTWIHFDGQIKFIVKADKRLEKNAKKEKLRLEKAAVIGICFQGRFLGT
jgi:hypothetical protein